MIRPLVLYRYFHKILIELSTLNPLFFQALVPFRVTVSFKEMNKKGATVFLTTHNIEEANVICERVGIINKGRITAIDTPESLKRTFEQTQSVEVSFGMWLLKIIGVKKQKKQ